MFSLTSSQGQTAYEQFKNGHPDDPNIQTVEQYMRGNANPVEEVTQEPEEPSSSVPDDNPLRVYVSNLPIPDQDDDTSRAAFDFLKRYVGVITNNNTNVHQDGDGEEAGSQQEEEGDTTSQDEEGRDATTSQDEAPINDGIIVQTEQEATRIFNDDITNPTFNKLKELLENQVPRNKGKKVNKKSFISWLQQPNSKRRFWFYKKQVLYNLAKGRGLPVAARPTDETDLSLIEMLADNQQGNDNVEAVANPHHDYKYKTTEAILKHSYLKHQKGEKREHCSLGHRLEKPIAKAWIQEAEKRNDIDSVEGFYTVGLCESIDVPGVRNSCDFVAVVHSALTNELERWGFECKGRVTVGTSTEEQAQHIDLMNNPHIRIKAKDVYKNITSVEEHFQLLHHAFVYDFETVVIAISNNQGTLIRSVIVDFDDELKEAFGNVMKGIKEISLNWLYNQ